MMKCSKFGFVILLGGWLTGCGSTGVLDVYQEQSREIIAYLLSDFPLPDDAEIQKLPTVILGTGTGIAGRIVLYSDVSPAENLIFYGNSTQGSGWSLVSSTVAEEIILIYSKEGRHATIEIGHRDGLVSGRSNNDSSSQITVSVVHDGAVQDQNPYLALDARLSELDRALAQQD